MGDKLAIDVGDRKVRYSMPLGEPKTQHLRNKTLDWHRGDQRQTGACEIVG